MIYKRKLSQGVTDEKLKQFWNHRIHPITGFISSRTDIYTNTEKENKRKRR